MSNTPTQELIDNLRRSVRRWKTLALTLLAALGLVIVVGTVTAVVQVQMARVARQSAMDAREQVEQERLEAAPIIRLSEQMEGRSTRWLTEGLAALNPPIRVLLKESAQNDPEHKSRFFTILATLAQKHGSDIEGYVGQRPLSEVDEGYAVYSPDGERKYVVAILRGYDNIIPGRDTQYLLLLDAEGRLLDRLSCGISNRLTRMFDDSGIFRTEVPEVAVDGAQFVIRYIAEDGGRLSGWDHEINHAGKWYHFHWSQDLLGEIPSAEWAKKGLCRVAISKGRFAVLFPEIKEEIAAD
jgi:hypothetical protein